MKPESPVFFDDVCGPCHATKTLRCAYQKLANVKDFGLLFR